MSKRGISGLGDPLLDIHWYDLDLPITALSDVLEKEPPSQTTEPSKEEEEQPASPTTTEMTTQSHTEN